MVVWTAVRSVLQAGRLAVARRIASLSGAFCSCFFCRENDSSQKEEPRNMKSMTMNLDQQAKARRTVTSYDLTVIPLGEKILESAMHSIRSRSQKMLRT